MSKFLITQELFDNLSYDTPIKNLNDPTTTTVSDNGNKKPTVLIVFSTGDINSSLYYLNKSLKSPFDPQAIATVLVHEPIKQDFVEKLQLQLNKNSSSELQSNKDFVNAFEMCKKLNALTITAENLDENVYQPTLVCDFTHEHLGASSPSGIVTLHTFRTAKEAIALVNKESLKFSNVSIWNENHSCAYELVAALKSENFFINCYQVPTSILDDSISQGKNYVWLDKEYHYETLQHDGIQKNIVFPIGTIFAN